MEQFRLNTRIASNEREYLLQTAIDPGGTRVISSVFTDGELLETIDEGLVGDLSHTQLREKVKALHQERQGELECLFDRFKETSQTDDIEEIDCVGQALMSKQMYSEAAELFERAISLQPDAHQVLSHLGQAFMALSDFQRARKCFEKCVKLRDQFADYHNQLGEAYLAGESCKEALTEFDKATSINLYYGDAYFNKALVYILNAIKREDFALFSEYKEKTLEMLERSIMVCPELRNEYFENGKRLFDNGDLENSYRNFLLARDSKRDRTRRQLSSSYLRFLLGTEQLNERVLTKRIKGLKAAIADDPHYCDLHYELAVAYTLLGRFIHAKAVEEYREALRYNENYERAKKSLKLAENELRGFDALVRAITKGE